MHMKQPLSFHLAGVVSKTSKPAGGIISLNPQAARIVGVWWLFYLESARPYATLTLRVALRGPRREML